MPTYSNSASVSSNISDGGSVGAWSANGVGGGLSAWLSNATPVPDYTDYIAATGFGFAIPSNETIVGIEADYPVKAFFGTGFSGTARDHSVLLWVAFRLGQTTSTRRAPIRPSFSRPKFGVVRLTIGVA